MDITPPTKQKKKGEKNVYLRIFHVGICLPGIHFHLLQGAGLRYLKRRHSTQKAKKQYKSWRKMGFVSIISISDLGTINRRACSILQGIIIRNFPGSRLLETQFPRNLRRTRDRRACNHMITNGGFPCSTRSSIRNQGRSITGTGIWTMPSTDWWQIFKVGSPTTLFRTVFCSFKGKTLVHKRTQRILHHQKPTNQQEEK